MIGKLPAFGGGRSLNQFGIMELVSSQDGSRGAPGAFPVETNLVFVAFAGRAAAEVSRRLAAEGVLANPEGSRPDALRFVTHLDVSRADIDEALRRAALALAS